jgi:HSP20 family molecular chaperone IbpA
VRKDVKTVDQILNGLGDLLDGLSNLVEHGGGVLRQTIGSRTGRAGVTYGWSIGAADSSPHSSDDADRGRSASPRSQARHGTQPEVFDEGEYVRTVVDVPGVVDDDLTFHVNGQDVTIEARHHDGRRVIRLRVPAPVSADGATSSYRNGIFEILLPKRRGPHGAR